MLRTRHTPIDDHGNCCHGCPSCSNKRVKEVYHVDGRGWGKFRVVWGDQSVNNSQCGNEYVHSTGCKETFSRKIPAVLASQSRGTRAKLMVLHLDDRPGHC